MIKFKKHNKCNNNSNIEYIKYDNLIIPIKSIVYIDSESKFSSVTESYVTSYIIYFAQELRYANINPFGNNVKEYKLKYKSITINEYYFNKLIKPILNNKIVEI